jgi:hypothetical protein
MITRSGPECETIARGDRGLDQALIGVQCVGADVHEHRRGAPQDEGGCGRLEGERRHDDLVAGPHAGQHGGHFQCCRAGMGNGVCRAGGTAVADGFNDVFQFAAHGRWLAERGRAGDARCRVRPFRPIRMLPPVPRIGVRRGDQMETATAD